VEGGPPAAAGGEGGSRGRPPGQQQRRRRRGLAMGGGNGDERVAAPAPLGLRGPEGLSTAEERCGQRDCSRRAELSPPRPWRAAPRRPPPPTRFPVGARFPGGGGGDGLGKRFRFTLETHGCAPSGRRAWAQPWAQRGQARRRAEQRRMLVPALAVRRRPAPPRRRPAPPRRRLFPVPWKQIRRQEGRADRRTPWSHARWGLAGIPALPRRFSARLRSLRLVSSLGRGVCHLPVTRGGPSRRERSAGRVGRMGTSTRPGATCAA
jgi:hypothetical protein